MGFRFKKSFKIARGVKLNISKKGLSSISLGGKGASLNLGRKSRRTTVGIPNTGLSYTKTRSYGKTNRRSKSGGWAKWIAFFAVILLLFWLFG